MLLLKSFFRKKSTKIYLIVIPILIISITLFSAFYKYYLSLSKSIVPYSKILIITREDIFEKFSSDDDYIEVDEGIVFKSNDEIAAELYMFEELECIIVFPASKRKIELNDNEIAIGSKFLNNLDLINKTVKLKHNNQKINFKVKTIYERNFKEILISDNKFEELINKSNIFAYTLKVKEKTIIDSLENINNFQLEEGPIIYETFNNSPDYNLWKSLKELVTWLTIISYIMIIMFSIIFLIVLRNIIIDEYKIIHTERLLGFSKNQVRKSLFLKMLCFLTVSFILSTIFSKLFIIIINITQTTLFFDFKFIFKMYVLILFVSFLFSFFYQLKNKNI